MNEVIVAQLVTQSGPCDRVAVPSKRDWSELVCARPRARRSATGPRLSQAVSITAHLAGLSSDQESTDMTICRT
jgi:hypothetical protein